MRNGISKQKRVTATKKVAENFTMTECIHAKFKPMKTAEDRFEALTVADKANLVKRYLKLLKH